MDSLLYQVLRAANPWLDRPEAFPAAAAWRVPEPFVPRRVAGIASWPVSGKAHLLVGARQVGKTSLLWQRVLAAGTPPLFLDAAEPSVREWCRHPVLVLRDLRDLVSAQTPVLLDEAQHLEEAGLLIKGLVDGGLAPPLYVTGSSAFHLRARTRESLAGRAVRVQLHPFSLAEIAGDLSHLAPIPARAIVREAASSHVVRGGYPEAWRAEDPEPVLARLVDAFVLRDASDLGRIQDLTAFRTVLALLARQVGNLVNVSEWAAYSGVSRGTVDRYLDLLEECHLVRRVPPFAAGRRLEVTHRPKVLFCDCGLRNLLVRSMAPFPERPDAGALFENWVGAELLKGLDPLHPLDVLRTWRSSSGAEVDWVLDRPDGLVAVEVKAAALRRPQLSRSARSFIAAYSPRDFWVVNLDLCAEEQLGGTRVHWVGPEGLLPGGILR